MISSFSSEYIAGLFDGEGSAGIYIINHKPDKKHPIGYRIACPTVQIKMCDKEPLDYVARCFDSKVNGPYSKKIKGHKDYYCWGLTYRRALEFAKVIIPFIINPSKKIALQNIVDYYINFKPAIKGQPRYMMVQ